MTETVFSAGKPSRPRRDGFADLGKRRGARKIFPFLETNRRILGGRPRKNGLQFCVPASVFSAGKPSRPRRECFAVLGRRRGGTQVFPGFGGKLPDFRGMTPKNRTQNFERRPPFSQLGNPDASVLRCSERGRGARRSLPVLEANCLM